MRLGVDITTITPPTATNMGGYGARTGSRAGTHDPLTARTLVFEDGGRKRALLVADLILFPRSQAERIAATAAALSGLEPADILVTATHTHSGPLNFDAPEIGGMANPRYVAWLEKALGASVARAAANLSPVAVGWGTMPVYGVGAIRRAGGETGVREAGVREAGSVSTIGFAAPDGSLRAVLMHYACHPTVLGAENLLYSSDLLGAARASLERELGGGVPVVAVNGACGDVSTRFTRRGQTFSELDRLGTLVGKAARAALSGVVYHDVPPNTMASAAVALELPRRPLPEVDVALAELNQAQAHWAELQRQERAGLLPDHGAMRLAKTALEGALTQVKRARAGAEAPLETEALLTAWRFDSCGLVTVPGELFLALGEDIARESGVGCCLVVGYAGGYVGYIPDGPAYAEGGYEVLSTHLDRQAGPLLVAAAASLLRALGREKPQGS
ncbi:MAG TPA: neutral/alkaline non-lysosomal ceramidase N-terminal domain-containing protein [Symbiobacteriaceae bacterium]|jgi:hypothetical protein